ncbi:MAG TPA: phosphonate ABC transporter, permease protein PhnE [Caldimonas sp.]|jgi:phosphonate transport system permease protein
MSQTLAAAAPERIATCRGCIALAVGVAAAVIASFAYLAVDWRQLFSAESTALMAKFVREFFPPDVSAAFIAKTTWGALQTFAVAAVGTLLAAALGAALALPAAGRFGLAPRLLARLVLNFLRSVPELVWAALMVIAAGLGPFAGTLALALHTTGVLGRLYAESLENAPGAPEQALRDSGSGRIAAFAYATLPLVTAQGVAYALYRLEMNIRMAAVLGFVGAGGLGQMLYFHLSIFQQAQASTLLIAMFLLVFAVDSLSALVRARLLPAHG